MRLCFPVETDEGLESRIYNHFGSAPAFVVIDTATGGVSTILNRDQNHVHGACNPVRALDHQHVDSVIVGGIGAGALSKLNGMGIVVHRATPGTIRDNVALHSEGKLEVLSVQKCCGGHGPDGGCSH